MLYFVNTFLKTIFGWLKKVFVETLEKLMLEFFVETLEKKGERRERKT